VAKGKFHIRKVPNVQGKLVPCYFVDIGRMRQGKGAMHEHLGEVEGKKTDFFCPRWF